MTVLVTGGAGFIGANFIFYQLTHHPEDRVVCLDKLTYAGNLETLADVMENPNFRFVQGDIADAQAVERLLLREKPDYVVNFAAESHVDRSITQPDLFLKTNVLGTGVLLDACRRHGVTRYHQVSTDEVYGDLPLDRPDLFFTEETPIHTSSPYSASKAGADLLVLAALGKPESLITFVTDRPGHDRRYAIDPTKIHRELGWQPETDFDTGLRRTVEWYLTHRDWWSHILSGEYQNYFQAMYRERLGE